MSCEHCEFYKDCEMYTTVRATPTTNHQLHVTYVYKDPEFQDEVAALFPARKMWLEKINNQDSADRKIQVYNQMVAEIKKLDVYKVDTLAQKYRLTNEDIWLYVDGQYEAWGFPHNETRPYALYWHSKTRTYRAVFREDITDEEFKQMWSHVAENKRSNDKVISQPKRIKHHKLVYAIFKARQKSKPTTFPDIYDQYKAGTLPYFIGERNTYFNDYKKLENYYDSNKPDLSTRP